VAVHPATAMTTAHLRHGDGLSGDEYGSGSNGRQRNEQRSAGIECHDFSDHRIYTNSQV
jgi:hypothetical protein